MSIDWTIQWTLTNNTGSKLTGRRDYKDRMSEASGSGPFTVALASGSTPATAACTLPSDDDYCFSVDPHTTRSVSWKYSIDVDSADKLDKKIVHGFVEMSDTGAASEDSFQVRWWFDTARRMLTFEVEPHEGNVGWTCGVLKAGINVTISDAAHPAAAASNSQVNVDHVDGPSDLRRKLRRAAEDEVAPWAKLIGEATTTLAGKAWTEKSRSDMDDVGKNVDARDTLIKKYFTVLKDPSGLTDLQTRHPVDSDPSPGRDWCGIFAYWVIKQIRPDQVWNSGTGFPEPAGVDIHIQPGSDTAGGYSGYEILRPGDILYFDKEVDKGGGYTFHNNHFVMVTNNWGDGTVDYVQGNSTAALLAGTRVPLTFTGLTKVVRASPKSHGGRPLMIVRCAVPAPECASGCKLKSQSACPPGYGPEVFNHYVVVKI